MKTLIALLLLISFNTAMAQSSESDQSSAPNYQDAPAWTLPDADGNMVSFSDYQGKPLILHFWGTWCPYCKKLHPGLERVRAKYESQGLVVLGISVNEPIGADPAKVLTERGINFETLLEGDDVALSAFDIVGTPTTVFISPEGKILGSTMESNPDDPRFDKIAAYLVSLLDK